MTVYLIIQSALQCGKYVIYFQKHAPEHTIWPSSGLCWSTPVLRGPVLRGPVSWTGAGAKKVLQDHCYWEIVHPPNSEAKWGPSPHPPEHPVGQVLSSVHLHDRCPLHWARLRSQRPFTAKKSSTKKHDMSFIPHALRLFNRSFYWLFFSFYIV